MGESGKKLCIMCAWRETCAKRFTIRGAEGCIEYTRDLSIKKDAKKEETEKSK